jgi:hypothetical protein
LGQDLQRIARGDGLAGGRAKVWLKRADAAIGVAVSGQGGQDELGGRAVEGVLEAAAIDP